jgi:dUTP pyrophosphatase
MHISVRYDNFMNLKLFVDSSDEDLKNTYKLAAVKHNNKILVGDFIDAGFDLYTPSQVSCSSENVNKVDLQVKCCATMYSSTKEYATGFYMYPRSSLSKTPLRLANSVGIIDAGYRGNLIGMFDYKDYDGKGYYLVEKNDRLLQICAPSLVPIYVEVVDNEDALGPKTERGTSGFGSTSGVDASYKKNDMVDPPVPPIE